MPRLQTSADSHRLRSDATARCCFLAPRAGSATIGARASPTTATRRPRWRLSARAEIAANRVVDVYLADVEIGADGAPTPLHYREKMRVKGPSVRLDLGKQAAQEERDDRA